MCVCVCVGVGGWVGGGVQDEFDDRDFTQLG